jgi:hypothetical protein
VKSTILVIAVASLPLAAAPDREIDDIREATYRHMFGEPSKQDSMYCLSIYEKDPSDGLMARFKGSQPPVTKGSKCEPLEEVTEPFPKQPSPVAFVTYYVDRPSDTRAEVLGAYFKNGRNAAESLFYLERTDGKWKVVKAVQRWIS